MSIDGNPSWVRFLVNNHYIGRYRILFDGTGTLGALAREFDGRWYIDLDGSGTNEYIDILTSAKDDPVKNILILPESQTDSLSGAAASAPGNSAPEANSPTLFIPEVDEALREFHVIRFMDIQRTNFSVHRNREDRALQTYYSQATIRGMSYEYAKSEVDCKLYTTFHFIGDRKTRHGSWGHLESLSQIGTDYRTTAPKYQALLDTNTAGE